MTHAGPVALFFACLVSGLVVPIPEDVTILVAGWQIREGTLAPVSGAVAAAAGTLGRDAIAFLLGRLFVNGVVRWPRVARLWDQTEHLRSRIEERAGLVIFVTRFLVGVRAPLYFAGGASGFPFSRFLALDLLGLLVTTPLLLGLGWWVGHDAATWLVGALPHQRMVLVGLGGLAIGAVVLRWLHRAQPPVA